MMKKTRTAIAIAAAAVLTVGALGLVACSKDPATDVPTPDTPTGSVYTITLDANGGKLAGDSTVKTGDDGKLAALPATPTNNDSTKMFNGWYLNTQGTGTKITTSYVFDKDTTIYAGWTEDTPSPTGVYTITFNANEGTFGDDTTTKTQQTAGGKLSTLPEDPTREGYKFVCWEDASGAEVDTDTVFTADTTVKAAWQESAQSSLPLDGMVSVEAGYQDSEGKQANVYLVGSFSGSEVQEEYGYFGTAGVPGYGGEYTEYKVENIELKEGDKVYIYAPSWDFRCNTLEETCTPPGITVDGDYFVVEQDGSYSFYLKAEYENDRIWISVN